MKSYTVIGPCAVDGVPPGGTVTHEQLEKAGANIDALLTFHLEETDPSDDAEAPAVPAQAKRPVKP